MSVERLKWSIGASLMAICLLVSQNAFAGGFYLSEIASPGSLGTAGVANVTNNWGTDSVWANPAGMTGLKRDQVLIGMQALIPNSKFDSSIATAGGDDGGNAGNIAMIPGTYGVLIPNDRLRLGLSVAAPLGGGVDYRNNFVGRYQAIKATIQGLFLSPAIAYKVSDRLSLGAGVSAINTIFNEDIAINQPGDLPDGKMKMKDLDDWSYQGFFGLTFQIADPVMLGAVYRTKSDVDLEGDLKFRNIDVPPLNLVTSKLDKMKLSFDYPQLIDVGVKWDVTEKFTLLANFDWEDWSQFSENRADISGGDVSTIQTIDRNWKDTWHVGAGLAYNFGNNYRAVAGASYDSSVVDDEDRTCDLPLDETFQLAVGFGTGMEGNLRYGLAATFMYLGDGKMDQTAQGTRFKGEFDTNYILMVGGMLQYRF